MIFGHHDDDYVKGMSYTYCYGYHSVVNGRNDNDHWEMIGFIVGNEKATTHYIN